MGRGVGFVLREYMDQRYVHDQPGKIPAGWDPYVAVHTRPVEGPVQLDGVQAAHGSVSGC